MTKIKKSIIFFIACVIFFEACTSQKKIVYDFPETMKPEVRDQYTKMCDKGKILYEINCAKCHNTVVKGKQIIPDFSPEKLTGYELRVANAQHEGSMPDSRVSPEELGLITFFLGYKKKNGQAK